MSAVLEQEVSTVVKPHHAEDAQAEAIAQRLEQYRQTKALIASMPQRNGGVSPTAQEYRAMAYENIEATSQ